MSSRRHDLLQAARLELEQQLSDRRVELADEKTVSSYVSDLHNLLSESSLAEKKSFVRSFVKEVKVTGDEVLLTYTMPMLSRGITEEKLPEVLPMVTLGGAEGTRTPDLLRAREALSQLSHSPTYQNIIAVKSLVRNPLHSLIMSSCTPTA